MPDPTSPGLPSDDASAIDAWLADDESASAPTPEAGAIAAAPSDAPPPAPPADEPPADADPQSEVTSDPWRAVEADRQPEDVPSGDASGDLELDDVLATVPAAGAVSARQPEDALPDLPAGEMLIDLQTEPVPSDPRSEDVLGGLPTGEVFADLQDHDAAPEPPAAPEGPPASLLQAVTALDAKDAPAPSPASAPAPAPAPAPDARYVLFTVAGAQFAVPETCVTELDRVPKITIVPNVPGWVRGVTNRRGDILSVVDTRSLLGSDRTDLLNARMLVVRLLDDTCSLGLLVDDVQQIASVPLREIRPPASALEGPLAPFLTGLFELDRRTVAVLDMERLLRSPTIRQFDEPTEGTTDA
jgi:purine-binding chemotaxis protein CheW